MIRYYFLPFVCFINVSGYNTVQSLIERILMPDIALRFNKDMLVLSTPIDYQLKAQGFLDPGDREYVVLCEPELVEETYKLEKVMDTPCFVTATEGITRARLAFSRFEKQAHDMARISYEIGSSFNPQHLIAAIGPTGLPLDPTMTSSVKQSIQQYRQAASELGEYPFDALLFSAFSSSCDAECALKGARDVFYRPIFITLAPSEDGYLSDGVELSEGIAVCETAGADVVGISSKAYPELLVSFVRTIKKVTTKPLMVDVQIGIRDSSQFEPTKENPYPTPDALFVAACALQQEGVQFLRASGSATPSYTGALNAAVLGSDVKVG